MTKEQVRAFLDAVMALASESGLDQEQAAAVAFSAGDGLTMASVDETNAVWGWCDETARNVFGLGFEAFCGESGTH